MAPTRQAGYNRDSGVRGPVFNEKGEKISGLAAGEEMIAGASGRVRKEGTVKIDGVKYTVENYRVSDRVNAD